MSLPKENNFNPHTHDENAPTYHDPHPFPITRFKGEGSNRPYCHNVHDPPKSGLTGGHGPRNPYHKVAVAQILILGYPTNLCQSCLTLWEKTWNSALSPSSNDS